MSKNINFEVGTVVTDTFLDGLQELMTGSMFNVRLAENPSSDRLTLAKDGDLLYDAEGPVNIAGRHCFITSDKDSTPAAGGAGTKNIYLSTTAGGTPKQPDFDMTISNTPPVASYIRNIGSADYAGGILSNVKLKNGLQVDADQYNSFTFQSVRDYPTETFLTLRGGNNQTSLNAVQVPDPSVTPTRALSVGYDTLGVYGEHLYIDTRGRLVWTEGATDLSLSWLEADVLGTNTEFASRPDGADTTAFSTRREGTHTQTAWRIGNEGHVQWGSGTAALDTGFSRISADTLAMDAGDKFNMPYTITYLTDSGDLLTNKTYVDTRDAFVESTSKRFAFFITP